MSEHHHAAAKASSQGSGLLGRILTGRFSRYSSTVLLFIVFCVATGVGVFVIRDLRTASVEVQRMYAGSVLGLRQIGELQYQVQETRRSTLYALTTNDSNLQVQYADQSREADRRVTEGITQYLGQAHMPGEIEVGKRLKRDWSEYLKVRDEVLASILEGSTKEAVDLDFTGGVPSFERVRQDLEEIKRLYDEQASQQLDIVDRSSRRSVVRLIGVLCFTLLFAAVSAWAIQRSAMLGALQRSEASLRESKDQIQLLLDSSAEAIYGCDLEGRCIFSNAACARLLGYPRPADLLQRNMHDLMHPARADGSPYLPHDCRVCQALHHGKQVHSDHALFWRADGSSIPVEYWSYPMRNGHELLGAVVTFLDITERIQLEEQLRQAQKMEAVGRLAGGIAHDFNNLLLVIRGYSELVLDKLDSTLPVHAKVLEIHKAAERATALTQQLLAFSRMQLRQPKILDLNLVVADMGKMLRHLIPANIDLYISRSDYPQGVKADRSQIEQVVLNLALNARDAMPRGGKLNIETTTARLDSSLPRQYSDLPSGSYVILTVTDTGTGMNAETRGRIFEPFFTTKELGKGTGLGLATVYGIVKQSGGWIRVESEIDKGSTFQVFLPSVEEGHRLVDANRYPAPLPGGAETILLVEDQDNVRGVAREFLEGGGYKVLEAKDGSEGLQLAQQYSGQIHLLLTDMMMPRMDGPELARNLAMLRPTTKVMFMTGYTEDAASRHKDVTDPGKLLIKPFERGDLLHRVREILDRQVSV
jgi:PAS domain S-box-containing protein